MPSMILLNQMKKNILYILILIVLVGIFIPIFYVQAQDATSSTDYQLLTPLPCPPRANADFVTENGKSVLKTFNPKAEKPLGAYLNLMIKLVIGLSAVMAVVMIVIGGIEYMTSELPGNKESGKERIKNGILGLLIALGAYALLNTINPDLLNSDVTINEVKVTVDLKNEDIPQGCKNEMCGGFKEGINWATTTGKQPTPMANKWMSTNNKPECAKVGDEHCTSTLGLDITTAKTTQENCGCVLKITGGTETWLHGPGTSHKPGSSTVDLAFSTNLDNYIITKGTLGKNGNNSIYIIGDIKYFKESDHWHVYK